MSSAKPTVCIAYGFCEGPRVAGRFHQALQAKGYRIINDLSLADCIITHSGGSLLLPPNLRATQIIHMAPFHWPGKSWLASMAYKLAHDLHTHHKEGELHFWARKTFWNAVYFWNFGTHIRMWKGISQGRHWQYGPITTVIRPRFDSFCVPVADLFPFTKSATFVSVPGQHDDCWRDPAPYIALLR